MSKYIPVLKTHHTGQAYWQVEEASKPGVCVGCIRYLHPEHGQQIAEMDAIKYSDIAVFRVVLDLIFRAYAHQPALHARIRRAGFLVIDHKVATRPGQNPNYHAAVFSQNDSGRSYEVNRDDHGATCTCPDFHNGAPRVQFLGRMQPVCKHLLAWGIAVKLHRVDDDIIRAGARARQEETKAALVEANARAEARHRGRVNAQFRRQQEETGKPVASLPQPF